MSKTYYFQNVKNPVTGEIITIKAPDKYTLTMKVNNKIDIWEKQKNRLDIQSNKEVNIKNCSNATKTALVEIESYKQILNYTLNIDDKINWEKLFKNDLFSDVKPELINFKKSHGIIGMLKFIP
jgi:restriction system protein